MKNWDKTFKEVQKYMTLQQKHAIQTSETLEFIIMSEAYMSQHVPPKLPYQIMQKKSKKHQIWLHQQLI